MTDDILASRAALNDLAFASAAGRGVVVAERDGLGVASVLARKGQLAPLAERIRKHFGIELPRGPRRIASGAVAFAGIAPEAWLATSEAAGNAFASFLKQVIGDVASVADQSSGYAILRLTGPKLRETLAKMLPIDLHPRAFQPGDVASTTASHIGATLWRLQDATDGAPVFEIAVFRSLADSFWHYLASSAAEFGLIRQASISVGIPGK
jgi:heterotetrameric sarcosine oxidase gamma subunit